MKSLSQMTNKFIESIIREMTRVCLAEGGLNLAQGFPDFDPPMELKQTAVEAIEAGRNQYSITFGEPDLREAITAKALRYNRIDHNPDTEITVTCGATEAMIATLKALVNPGDELIIFEPFYENYGPDAILSVPDPFMSPCGHRIGRMIRANWPKPSTPTRRPSSSTPPIIPPERFFPELSWKRSQNFVCGGIVWP